LEEDLARERLLPRVLVEPFRLLEAPCPLLDRFEPERLRLGRLLEDRVV